MAKHKVEDSMFQLSVEKEERSIMMSGSPEDIVLSIVLAMKKEPRVQLIIETAMHAFEHSKDMKYKTTDVYRYEGLTKVDDKIKS